MVSCHYVSGHLIADTFVTGPVLCAFSLGTLFFLTRSVVLALAPYNDDKPSSLGLFHDNKLYPIQPELIILNCSPTDMKILSSSIAGFSWNCLAVDVGKIKSLSYYGMPNLWLHQNS